MTEPLARSPPNPLCWDERTSTVLTGSCFESSVPSLLPSCASSPGTRSGPPLELEHNFESSEPMVIPVWYAWSWTEHTWCPWWRPRQTLIPSISLLEASSLPILEALRSLAGDDSWSPGPARSSSWDPLDLSKVCPDGLTRMSDIPEHSFRCPSHRGTPWLTITDLEWFTRVHFWLRLDWGWATLAAVMPLFTSISLGCRCCWCVQ